jgi:O-glycosyl hydrolase
MKAYAAVALVAILSGANSSSDAATVTIDDSAAGQAQTMDGFGTCIGSSGSQDWFQQAYYDDMGCSMMRMDLTPNFQSPYSDHSYNSPWFSNPPPLKIDDPANLGGPDHNYVRAYTNAADYTREFGGSRAPIAVMGPEITKNIAYFDFDKVAAQGAMAQAGLARKDRLGDFKLYGSIWSPAPWVKVADGRKWGDHQGIMPATGTPYPFIWGGNFAGGKVDTSGTPLPIFDDGSGPTSALTQFARGTAAYVKGFQDKFGVKFYAISIQNELNFPEFYHSCVYATAPEYIAALKAVRQEFDRQPDLKNILIAGPEDLLGGDPYGMWQFGGGDHAIHKNLQYLDAIGKDDAASKALGFFCIHGYANDGATATGADSPTWLRWTQGWTNSPAPGIPSHVPGFTAYHKKSWMTETSGEKDAWLDPNTGFPGNGAWSVALKMQQALTAGRESAYFYWQFADGDGRATTMECLTRRQDPAQQPKFVAFQHFARFIRPGAIAVQAVVADDHGVTASAYAHPCDRTLVVVLVGKNSAPEPVSVTPPADFAGVKSFEAYTSSNGSYWQRSAPVLNNGRLQLDVPAYGVVTLVGRK